MTGSLYGQRKLNVSEVYDTLGSRRSSTVTEASEVNFSSNLTSPSLRLSKLLELDYVKQTPPTTVETAQTLNVKESNEMIVEPYPDNTFRCPFCETFKTIDVKEMRYHIFEEKNYDR